MLDQKIVGIKNDLQENRTTSFFSHLFSQTRSSKSETIGLELNFRKRCTCLKLYQGFKQWFLLRQSNTFSWKWEFDRWTY